MTHCTIDQLTDHLLGEVIGEADDRVSSHLVAGCQRCSRLLTTLARVREVGRRDAAQPPPDQAVRTVKALHGLAHPGPSQRQLKMRLRFDSLLRPAPAGTRSLHNSSRHLVFYSQSFALDLRLDSERSARDVVVVGQLLSRDWGPLADVPAYLISGDRVVSHSTTGRLGEFHMEGRPRGLMHLHLIVSEEELIDVELDRRQQGNIRPVLLHRDDLAARADVPDSIHSRTSDSNPRRRDPRP